MYRILAIVSEQEVEDGKTILPPNLAYLVINKETLEIGEISKSDRPQLLTLKGGKMTTVVIPEEEEEEGEKNV